MEQTGHFTNVSHPILVVYCHHTRRNRRGYYVRKLALLNPIHIRNVLPLAHVIHRHYIGILYAGIHHGLGRARLSRLNQLLAQRLFGRLVAEQLVCRSPHKRQCIFVDVVDGLFIIVHTDIVDQVLIPFRLQYHFVRLHQPTDHLLAIFRVDC